MALLEMLHSEKHDSVHTMLNGPTYPEENCLGIYTTGTAETNTKGICLWGSRFKLVEFPPDVHLRSEESRKVPCLKNSLVKMLMTVMEDKDVHREHGPSKSLFYLQSFLFF